MPQSVSQRVAYISILSAFLLLGILFAWRVPDWQAPDEPAHYNYIAQVATGELLPIIEMGDWDNEYLETLKANDFAPNLLDDLASIQYEDHQPPLYYWLASPIFVLTDGNLFALRMVSVLLSMITVALSYTICLTIFPEQPHRALAVMALVAFLPQNVHMLASINNDALAGVVIAVLILLSVRYLQNKSIPVYWLGIFIGIAFITKTTSYFMAGVVLIVIGMRWWQNKQDHISDLLREYVLFGIPASIFAILYWGRNIITYSFPDFLGLKAHDEVVIGQPRRLDFIAEFGQDTYWREAFVTTFNSFWGQFGWMEARLADALPIVFGLIVILVILAMSGLVLYFIRLYQYEGENTAPIRSTIWITLGLVMLLAMAQFVYYNITFVQFQGRYLFVAIIPFAIGMIVGVDSWRELLFKQNTITKWGVVAIFASFAVLDLYLIWRVIPCAVGC